MGTTTEARGSDPRTVSVLTIPTLGYTSDHRGDASVARLSSRSGRAVVVAAVLGTALAYMSDDMLNVAIPSVARDLGGTITDIRWVVDSYYVTLVALVLVAGAVGDRIGHRRLLFAGMGRAPIRLIRRHPLLAFYVITFALSWGYWVPVALLGGRSSHAPGLLGPMVGAIVITGATQGFAGLQNLVARMLRWGGNPRCFVLAVSPLLIAIAAAAVIGLAGGTFPPFARWTDVNGFSTVDGWLALVVFLFVNGYGEETGWRGFALPTFRRRNDPIAASALVAVPWALWHLPLFFIDSGYRDFPLLAIPGWLCAFFAASIVLTWLYEASRSSIFIPALMHTTMNMGSNTAATTGAIGGVVTLALIAWSLLILASWRRRRAGFYADHDDSLAPYSERGELR